MFWFRRKTLVGSYRFLISTSLSQVAPGYALNRYLSVLSEE